MSHPIRRSIICEICQHPRQTQSRFDVCPGCAHKLAKIECDACNQMRFHRTTESAICLSCENKLLRDKILCACGDRDYAFKLGPGRCRKCHQKVNRRYCKDSWSAKVKCPSCGKANLPFRNAY